MIDGFSDAGTQAAAVRAREVSARELATLHLERIARDAAGLEPINAVVTLDADRALEIARRCDEETARGVSRGPLHGVPCTIKDAIAVGGVRSTGGAVEYADHVPARDAPAVEWLRTAGAVVLGKTNCPRWSGDYQTYNEIFGTTRNPWDRTRTPGGSSGGAAAAVAAGLTAFELGTDIGGSIRVPSSFCGLAGLKTSYGIVPDRGYLHYPGSGRTSTDVSVFGPIARSSADLGLLLDVLAGPDPYHAPGWRLALPPARPGPDWRVAVWLDDDVAPVRSDVRAVLESAAALLQSGGAQVRTGRPAVTFDETMEVYAPVVMAAISPSFPHGHPAASGGEHAAWLRLQDRRQDLRERWAAWFADTDVLLLPTYPVPAFPHDTGGPLEDRVHDVDGRLVTHFDCARWLGYAGLVDLPVATVPVGRSREGLPVGVQIVGRFLADRTVLAAAAALEAAMGGFVAPPGSP